MSTSSTPGAIGKFFGAIMRLALPIAILAIGGYGYTTLSVEVPEEKERNDRQQKIKTRVAELTVHNFSVEVRSQGTVRPHNEISLSAIVSGQIVELSPNIESGSYFSEGEVLIRLDDRDYRASMKAAEASLQSARSSQKLAQIEHDRTVAGFTGDGFSVVTEAEVDQTAAALARSKAALNEAEAALDQAKLDLERTSIKAPFDGRVRTKNVGLGQTISPGTEAATVFAVDYAEVRLPITGADQQFLTLPEFEGSEPVPVELYDAIQPDSPIRWQGEIVRTEGALDAGSLELIAVARIYDPFGLKSGEPPLRIGQPVTATIRGKELQNVVSIPRMAVRELDQVILVDKTSNQLKKVAIDPIWSDDTRMICANTEAFENAYVATTHIVYAPEGAPVEILSDGDSEAEPETEPEPEADSST